MIKQTLRRASWKNTVCIICFRMQNITHSHFIAGIYLPTFLDFMPNCDVISYLNFT